MRLRHKKMHNLSQDALYTDFQNLHFQTHNRKPDFEKTPTKDCYKRSINTEVGKLSDAEILVKFIANINLAKQSQRAKSKSKSHYQNVLKEQNQKPKRLRKPSSNMSFEEEKKVEDIKPSISQSKVSGIKAKPEQKGSRPSSAISIPKKQPEPKVPDNKSKEGTEQNIINNCFINHPINMNDYARLMQSSYYLPYQPMIPNWAAINSFMVPNIPQLKALTQNIENGLSWQLQMYSRFCPQSNVTQIEKSHFQTPAPHQKCDEKNLTICSGLRQQKAMSPVKIFKRASYHVGIAYNIYMDNIQREGTKIKNFEEIDPTRHAKRIKSESQKSH